MKTQAQNKRNTRKIIYNGKEYTFRELSEQLGITRQALYMRYYRKEKL